MRIKYHVAVASTLALVVTATAPARAQDAKTDSLPTYTAVPRAQRPTIVVAPFAFQAPLSAEDRDELNGLAGLAAAIRAANGSETQRQNQSAENLAKATSTLLAERLLATGNFRVLESSDLGAIQNEQNLANSAAAAAGQGNVAKKGAMLGAKYVVTGAITQFGTEKKTKGGILGGVVKNKLGGLGGGLSKNVYTAGVTIRIVDASTREVITSITGTSNVEGGKKFSIAGIGGAAGAGFGSSTSGEREKMIGVAIATAVEDLVGKLVKSREMGELAP